MAKNVYEIEKITDEFAKKAFLSKLPKKVNTKDLKITMKDFEDITNRKDRLLSLHHLYAIVSDKYKRGATGYKKELLMSLYKDLKQIFYWGGPIKKLTPELTALRNAFKNHPQTLIDMSQRVSQKQATIDLKLYVYNSVVDKEKVKGLRDSIINHLDVNFDYADLVNFSEEMKDAFINEIAKQYE